MANISELKFDHKNARKRTDSSARLIQESLQRYGAARSIVIDEDNRILAGNGTIEAAKALGLAKLKVVEADGDEIIAVRRSGLSEDDKVGLALADNRAAELSDWDAEMLQQLSKEHDIAPWFEQEDLEALLEQAEQLEPVEGKTDPDEVPEAPQAPITKPGDLWILGNHRLLCGDSTKIQDVERLMDGNKAQTFFIDPPYGDNVGGLEPKKASERILGKGLVKRVSFIANDKEIDWLEDVFNLIPAFLEQENTKMVFCKWDRLEQVKQMAAAWGEPSALCVWDRVRKASAFFRFQPQHELCWHWGNQSDKKEQAGLSNVWRVPKELELKELHPTVKPIDIIEPALRVTTDQSKIVLDLFGGSGTTLIAAERSKRHAYLMELDPAYCDVIVKRWEDFTGNTAVCQPSADHFIAEQQEAF
jgi:DNA modification methylase